MRLTKRYAPSRWQTSRFRQGPEGLLADNAAQFSRRTDAAHFCIFCDRTNLCRSEQQLTKLQSALFTDLVPQRLRAPARKSAPDRSGPAHLEVRLTGARQLQDYFTDDLRSARCAQVIYRTPACASTAGAGRQAKFTRNIDADVGPWRQEPGRCQDHRRACALINRRNRRLVVQVSFQHSQARPTALKRLRL